MISLKLRVKVFGKNGIKISPLDLPRHISYPKYVETTDMKSQNFAVLVRSKREGLGLTQQQLAEQSDISVRTIKKIENDGHVPNSKFIDRLRDVLGIEDEDCTSQAVLALKYNLRDNLNRGDDIRHILKGMINTPNDYPITI